MVPYRSWTLTSPVFVSASDDSQVLKVRYSPFDVLVILGDEWHFLEDGPSSQLRSIGLIFCLLLILFNREAKLDGFKVYWQHNPLLTKLLD